MKKFFSGKNDSKEYVIDGRRVIVEDVIAEGGFSVVFLAYCEEENLRYALKRMLVSKEDTTSQQEIYITKKLSGHKNSVRLVGSSVRVSPAGSEVVEVLLLLQFYPDNIQNDMNNRIGQGFREGEVLKIFCDLCEVLAVMHQSSPPIIHRDLKIENLLKDCFGNCILCDFGSATTMVLDTQVHGFNRVSEEIQKYTTPVYRSPEMIDLYSNKPITTKSDIWAMGCLLYKLCFFTNCFGDSALSISNGNFTIPDSHGFSVNLLRLMKLMLEIDPDKRPDIFQVSHIAFKLLGKSCPVANKNNSEIPNLSSLLLPPTKTEAKLGRNFIVSRPFDQSDQSAGTSIAPRERPRGQLMNRGGHGLNSNQPIAGSNLTASSTSAFLNQGASKNVTPSQQPSTAIFPIQEVVSPSNDPFHPSDVTPFANNAPTTSQAPTTFDPAPPDDKPLIDLNASLLDQFEDTFVSPPNNQNFTPIPHTCQTFTPASHASHGIQGHSNYWPGQLPPLPHFRGYATGQSTVTPPFVVGNNHTVPIHAGGAWNPFQGTGNTQQVNVNPTLFSANRFGQPAGLPPSQYQNLLNRHRRNMSDTSALVPLIHAKNQAFYNSSSQTADNLNNTNFQQTPQTGSWSDRARQHNNHFQYQSSQQLQQQQNTTRFHNDSLLMQFDELTLRHSHSMTPIMPLDQSASSASLPAPPSSLVYHYPLSQSLATVTNQSQERNVDAFGAVPFNNMVSQMKDKHHENRHKRSVSEI